jgi:hypothetical protein
MLRVSAAVAMAPKLCLGQRTDMLSRIEGFRLTCLRLGLDRYWRRAISGRRSGLLLLALGIGFVEILNRAP